MTTRTVDLESRPAMSDREALERLIAREERYASEEAGTTGHAIRVADCAAQLIEARDLGDDGLSVRAEANLRKALEWWR